MRKKTFFVLALQVVVIGVFVLIAVGSASQSSTSSSFKEGVRTGINAYSTAATVSRAIDYASQGYTNIGNYSVSDCPKKCTAAGYTHSWKYASNNTGDLVVCYCK